MRTPSWRTRVDRAAGRARGDRDTTSTQFGAAAVTAWRRCARAPMLPHCCQEAAGVMRSILDEDGEEGARSCSAAPSIADSEDDGCVVVVEFKTGRRRSSHQHNSVCTSRRRAPCFQERRWKEAGVSGLKWTRRTSLVIYTIGHSTIPRRGLLELLRAHGIRQLADVRSLPQSRRHPHLQGGPRDALEAAESSTGTSSPRGMRRPGRFRKHGIW